jgi:hypothetical protein
MLKFILVTKADDASPIIVNASDIAYVAQAGEHTEITDFNEESITVLESVQDVFAMLQQA